MRGLRERAAVGWALLVGVAAVASLAAGLTSAHPRPIFGMPSLRTTQVALDAADGAYVELTDARFDCMHWTPGSGQVPLSHPGDATLTFTRDNVCHGYRADAVRGVVDAGSPQVLRSLVPMDDPVLLGLALAALLLLVAVLPWSLVVAPGAPEGGPPRSPERVLEELAPGMHPDLRRRLVREVTVTVLLAGTCFGAFVLGAAWAAEIVFVEPAIWREGVSVGPVVVDATDALWVTWMDGGVPNGRSIDLLYRLEPPFVGVPEVRALDGAAVSNLDRHHQGSRLLFLGVWCLVAGVFAVWVGLPLRRLAQIARVGSCPPERRRFGWLPLGASRVDGAHGRRLLHVQDGVSRWELVVLAPHTPLVRDVEGGTEVLVVWAEGVAHPEALCADGHPFRLGHHL